MLLLAVHERFNIDDPDILVVVFTLMVVLVRSSVWRSLLDVLQLLLLLAEYLSGLAYDGLGDGFFH